MAKRVWAILFIVTLALISAPRADAGCGCEKPPPPPAGVRPNATWAGGEVRVFSDALVEGGSYDVRFTSSAGTSTTIAATAIAARDLADGVSKIQIVMELPLLPLGPVALDVVEPATGQAVLALGDAELTAIPAPIGLPDQHGEFGVAGYQAAVSREGVTYLSFDLGGIAMPLVVRAQALGYPLRFAGDDVVFYNAQGFMMQLLDGSIPGLFSIESASSLDSDALQYSRHEFNTHFLRHEERETHVVDPADPNWHVDGTPHIDHDLLVLAISATLPDGSVPSPGATSAFTLAIDTFSIFRHGLAATKDMELKNDMVVHGPVRANGKLKISDRGLVNGFAKAAEFDVSDEANVTGGTMTAPAVEFMPVDVPAGMTDLGELEVKDTEVAVLGPGSYGLEKLKVESDAELIVDNYGGPVTLYVTEKVEIEGTVSVTHGDPERFAIYLSGSAAKFKNDMYFTGVVYAPNADVKISGEGEFFGAFVAENAKIEDDTTVSYEPRLGMGDSAQ